MHIQYALHFVIDSIFVPGMTAEEWAVIIGPRLATTMSPAALSNP